MAKNNEAMTLAQRRVLGEVCRSNGSGISVYALNAADQQAFWALVRKGMIQGKLGAPELAVHTREGWKAWVYH